MNCFEQIRKPAKKESSAKIEFENYFVINKPYKFCTVLYSMYNCTYAVSHISRNPLFAWKYFFLQTTCINIKWSDHEHCMRDCIGNWFLNRFRELVTKNQWIFIFPTWKKQVFFLHKYRSKCQFWSKNVKNSIYEEKSGLGIRFFDLRSFDIFNL